MGLGMRIAVILFLVLFIFGCSPATWWKASSNALVSVQRGINECEFEAQKGRMRAGYGSTLGVMLDANIGAKNLFKSCMRAKGFYQVPTPQ